MKKIVITSLVLATTSLFAGQTSYTEYVQVTKSTPTYERVSTRTPYQECYDERVPVTSYSDNSGNSLTGSGIVGGIVGGVIGHQIGGGHGKDIATAGGAILGTLVGQNAARSDARSYTSTRYEIRRRCETRYTTSASERRFTGYKNVAYYKGRKIVKFSNRQLSSFPVTVTVNF